MSTKAVFFVVILFFVSYLYTEITNIQSEGVWQRTSYYTYGMVVKDNYLYVGSNWAVEKYHILTNGDLEYVDTHDVGGGVADLHIIGDSLFIHVSRNGNPHDLVEIVDITDNTQMQITQTFEPESLMGFDATFYSNDHYVLFFGGGSIITSYYYDRETHTLSELSFETAFMQLLYNNYLFDFTYENYYQGKLRIRDISDIEDPILIYESLEMYDGHFCSFIDVINDTLLAFTHTYYITETHLLDVSDILNPQIISTITPIYGGINQFTYRPNIINSQYIFYYNINGGERVLYNIEDPLTPTLACEWFVPDAFAFQTGACFSYSYDNYFYVTRGMDGIAKYDTANLPITGPEEYFGFTGQFYPPRTFDGQRVVYLDNDCIKKKESPDEEAIIIFQHEDLSEFTGNLCCSDNLTLIGIMDSLWTHLDFYIVETETGELMNSIFDLPLYSYYYFIEPYFYLLTLDDEIDVYEIGDNYSFNYITTINIDADSFISLWDTPRDLIWISSDYGVYLYDRFSLEEIAFYPNPIFSTVGQPVIPCFYNNYLIVSEGAYFTADEYSCHLFYFESPELYFLIDTMTYDYPHRFHRIEDDLIHFRDWSATEFSNFSPEGFEYPYNEYQFNGVAYLFYKDDENNRFFVSFVGRIESFTYDYESSIDDEEILTSFGFTLSNYPNPFNPETTISFNLTAEHAKNAELVIYNIKGQKVKTYSFPNGGLGTRSVVWNGKDDSGKQVGSGIYFYQLKAGKDFSEIKKMLILK